MDGFKDGCVHFHQTDLQCSSPAWPPSFCFLCIIQSPTTEDVRDDVRMQQARYQPCVLGFLHGYGDGCRMDCAAAVPDLEPRPSGKGRRWWALFFTSELGPRLLLSCYTHKQRASLFPPPCSALLNLIQRDVDPSVLPVVPGPQICPWTPRFLPSSSRPLRLSANAAPLLGWRLSKQFEFQSIAKKSTMQKKNPTLYEDVRNY